MTLNRTEYRIFFQRTKEYVYSSEQLQLQTKFLAGFLISLSDIKSTPTIDELHAPYSVAASTLRCGSTFSLNDSSLYSADTMHVNSPLFTSLVRLKHTFSV